MRKFYGFLGLLYCISRSYGISYNCSNACATANTWYIAVNESSSDFSPNGSACQYDNLDAALNRLHNNYCNAFALKHISILLEPGVHRVENHYHILPYSNVIFSPATANENATVCILNRILFVRLTNLSFVNLTVVLTESPYRPTSIRKDSLNGLEQLGIMTFVGCRNVKLDKCTINFSMASYNIFFLTSFQVTVFNCHFFYTIPPTLEVFNERAGNGSWGLLFFYTSPNPCKNCFRMSNTSFESAANVSFYGYGNIARNEHNPLQTRYLFGVVLSNTSDVIAEIRDTSVTGMVFGFAIPLLIEAINETRNSRITLDGIHIHENKCFSGCGMLIFFFNDCRDNFVYVRNSSFRNNTAVLEGGAVLIVYEKNKEENVAYFGNTNFEGNNAFQYFGAGSAVMIYSDAGYGPGNSDHPYNLPPKVIFEDCKFTRNKANSAAVFSKEANVIFNGTETLFDENRGGAVESTSSSITISGKAKFLNNSGCSFGCALDLRLFSHANFINVDHIQFQNNSASVHGGAIFADLTTSSETYVDLINSESLLDTGGKCFITGDDRLRYDFATSPIVDETSQIHFYNNKASISGNDVFASTLYLCNVSQVSAIPKSRSHFPISTAVASIFFFKATCDCFKDVDNVRFHFRDGECTRHKIAKRINSLKNNTGDFDSSLNASSLFDRMNETLECTVDNLIALGGGRGAAFQRDVVSHFVHDRWVPFGSCLYGSSRRLANSRFKDYPALRYTSDCSASMQPFDITLYPAPGERFTLYLDPRDELDRTGPVQASMQVLPWIDLYTVDELPPALLRQRLTEYGWDTLYYFDASAPINGLSLAGPVGAKGSLYVRWHSIFRGSECALFIDFELAPCQIGYEFPKDSSPSEAVEHIKQSKSTINKLESYLTGNFVCHCANLNHVECGTDGRELNVLDAVWVGSLEPDDFANVSIIDPSKTNGSDAKRKFGSHYCTENCYENSLETVYEYNYSYPKAHCMENYTGVLCGRCEKGKSLTLVTQKCVECKDWQKQLAITIVVTFITATIYISLSMVFRIVASSVFASWLFYAQVVRLFVRPQSFPSFGFQLTVYSTGFCIAEELSPLERLAFIAALQTVFFLLLFVIFLLARCSRTMAQYIKMSKVLDTFLIVLAYVYVPIAEFAFSAISCTVFIANEIRVLADPTLKCFDSEHTPFAVAGIVLLLTFVIPAPILFLVYLKHPKLEKKPFARRLRKACAHQYRKGTEWWISLTYFKRFVLVLFSTTAAVSVTARLLFLAFISLGMIFLQWFGKPYKKSYSNLYEMGVLVNLFLFAGLNVNDPEAIGSEDAAHVFLIVLLNVVFWWPYAVWIVYGGYRFSVRVRSRLGRKVISDKETLQKSSSSKADQIAIQKQLENLRDPLLTVD